MPSLPSLADDVAAYIGFGAHRAGTDSERATAAWFADRLETLGYAVAQRRFPIRTILDPSGEIASGSLAVPVFPQWLPPPDALGRVIRAPFRPLSADAGEASIRILTEPAPLRGNWGAAQDKLVRAAVAKGASALVLAPDDPTGDVYVSNQHDLAPLPLPVALVARRALPDLTEVARRPGVTAHLALSGRLTDAHAINVIAHKGGHGRAIVVSTPLTGWFTCGAERGPGVALALRMAARLAHIARPVLVLGTGSHEIGHLGMAHVLAHGAPAPADVCFWFHFGASIAARQHDAAYGAASPHNLIGSAVTEARVRSALSAHVPTYIEGNARTSGESGQVIAAGYTRFAGMVGTFPGFHTPSDRGEAIDFSLLEAIADATVTLLLQAVVEAD